MTLHITHYTLHDVYAGTDPAAFLDIGVGARALGMGGAFTSVADDATCAYWNPAGLGRIERINLSAMGQSLASSKWEGMQEIFPQYQFMSFLLPLEHIGLWEIGGTLGISLASLTLDGIPKTEVVNGKIVRDTFEDKESALFISYGLPVLGEELMAGGSLKLISQKWTKIKDASAHGWGLDIGLLYTLIARVRLGFMAQKGIQLKWANQHTDEGPLRTKLGFLYNIIEGDRFALLATTDFIQTEQRPLALNGGTELNFFPGLKGVVGISVVSVRAGVEELYIENRYGNMSQLNQHLNFSMGGGIKLTLFHQDIQLDYAFSSYSVGARHRFSIILGLL